jgi:hypothetical protein
MQVDPIPSIVFDRWRVWPAQCLKECEKFETKAEAEKSIRPFATKAFSVPGDAGWGLGGMYPPPKNAAEAEGFKAYFKQCREEVCAGRSPSHGRHLMTRNYPSPLATDPSSTFSWFIRRLRCGCWTCFTLPMARRINGGKAFRSARYVRFFALLKLIYHTACHRGSAL